MGTRAIIVLLVGLALTSVDLADAQQQVKVHKIGWLSLGSAASANIGSFLREFRKLVCVEGEYLAIDYRFADGELERLPDLVAELVLLGVEVIVAAGGVRRR